jgi:glucosylceramidase
MPAEDNLIQCLQVLITSEAGDKQAKHPNLTFTRAQPKSDNRLTIEPDTLRQKMQGIGTSFTQSSAFVLAHLEAESRDEVMAAIYSNKGANFSLARSHIGACDFCVEGKYTYAEVADDTSLQHFSIAEDYAPFNKSSFADICDPEFTLLPMIQQANTIKAGQGDPALKIIASAWTAPPWMKTIEDWYIEPSAATGYEGGGGELKPEYRQTYADYLIRYLTTYADEGVDIWGLTPVNEPHGNNGQWESMHFSPESQNQFIKDHLGPALHSSAHPEVKLLIYDQNRDGLEQWTDTILADTETAQYVYGTAVHWYESTYLVYEDCLERVHNKYPQFDIIHTEGCIDDLGKPAPEGILDPDGFQETGWFDCDAFWWNDNATDWAYTATWAPKVEDHPKYTPVHRYARNIIVSINHWMSGWIDWNIVLDQDGGPNHVGNFCGAPIMIDTHSKYVYYTPIYHVLSQFSRTIRPDDYAVLTRLQTPALAPDTLHACATKNSEDVVSVQLLNTSKTEITLSIELCQQVAELSLPANSVVTLQLQL